MKIGVFGQEFLDRCMKIGILRQVYIDRCMKIDVLGQQCQTGVHRRLVPKNQSKQRLNHNKNNQE